jgi:hypothetical protein
VDFVEVIGELLGGLESQGRRSCRPGPSFLSVNSRVASAVAIARDPFPSENRGQRECRRPLCHGWSSHVRPPRVDQVRPAGVSEMANPSSYHEKRALGSPCHGNGPGMSVRRPEPPPEPAFSRSSIRELIWPASVPPAAENLAGERGTHRADLARSRIESCSARARPLGDALRHRQARAEIRRAPLRGTRSPS